MRILILCPYMIDSHVQWAKGYQASSQHEVEILSLPGRHWKWRMHGAALTFALMYQKLANRPDVIIATDMMDLATFQAITRKETSDIAMVLYHHENQLTYPWSPEDQDIAQKRDRHYAWINYTSGLAADEIWFNSKYHQDIYLHSLPDFISVFPDFQEKRNVALIEKKSSVLPVGINGLELKQHAPSHFTPHQTPIILWNHRWEYDKGPEAFFETLFHLKQEHIPFQLVVMGRSFGKSPAIFKEAEKVLSDHILHWGYADDRAHYIQWLWKSDILPVTSIHEYQGLSVLEAIYCGSYPLLPNRLSYPELIPENLQEHHIYLSQADLIEKMRWLLVDFSSRLSQVPVERFDWAQLAPTYDERLRQLLI